jgi:hypothetical protein
VPTQLQVWSCIVVGGRGGGGGTEVVVAACVEGADDTEGR